MVPREIAARLTISPNGSELFSTLLTSVIKLVLKKGNGLRIVTIAPSSETAVSTNRSFLVYCSVPSPFINDQTHPIPLFPSIQNLLAIGRNIEIMLNDRDSRIRNTKRKFRSICMYLLIESNESCILTPARDAGKRYSPCRDPEARPSLTD